MKLSLFKKALITLVGFATIFTVSTTAYSATQPHDYNSNAIIYGGSYYITDLIRIVNNGNNRDNCAAKGLCPHQTSAELKALYQAVGMDPGWFGQLKSGTIYKDGHVELNGKTVATGVLTMGRHNLPGSTPFSKLPYTVYWRKPSVSFNSSSLPAWIFMNYDGTMGFGIVKSCGNPIKAAGVKAKPTPQPKPTPTPTPAPTPKFSITVKKYEDKDGDKVKDSNESMLAGWKFSIQGKTFNTTLTTDKNGVAKLGNLPNGTYRIKELSVTGWTCTTGTLRTITINGKNQEVWFGNRRIPVKPNATYSIIARKFQDDDGDGTMDSNEQLLSGWSIKLSKNGDNSLDRTFQTDADGEVIFTNLEAGTYTVSEIMQSGWKNITPISRTVTLPSVTGSDPIIEFGNQKVKTITVTPQGTPISLPTAGPIDTFAGAFGIAGISGSGVYYLKGKKTLLAALKKIK